MADRDYQTKFMNDVTQAWDNGHQRVMGVLPTGGGKCLGRGTPVLMYDGTIRPIESIRAGEFVMGPDGTPRGVLSLARGREMMYRVSQSSGSSYVVNESHILSVICQNGKILNVPVKHFIHMHNDEFYRGWRIPNILNEDLKVELTRISLERLTEDDYFGFELFGNDRLFLLGDFTVTHNTHCFSRIIADKDRPSVVVSHRQELVSQAAFALAREQIPYGIIAPQQVVSEIIRAEIDMFGRSYYQPRAHIKVAGVNTITVRDTSDKWFRQVEYVVVDEGHHVLKENIFGKAVRMFPTARCLFPTAHACRSDGRGLGSHADGLVDALVIGPSAKKLIDRGYLVDYRLVCPPSDIDLSQVTVGSTGDFVPAKLRAAVHRSSTIVGDVVREYMRFAPGKLGLTFAVDIESAKEIVEAFGRQGVPAEIITGDTTISDRAHIMRRFRARELLQLVSVDVLGEGTDVPAVEVVSMARPTSSFQLFAQQFGRAMRVNVRDDLGKQWDKFTDAERLSHIANSEKPKAIIIDHVNNWSRHGLPDVPRRYTLDRREKRSKRDVLPLKLCVECLEPYEAIFTACPHCGHKPEPKTRGTPEAVEGDLYELDPAVMAQLRGEVARIDNPPVFPSNVGHEVIGAIKKRHWERQQGQQELRAAIALWAGYWRMHGAQDSETYRRFFHMFGRDIMTAQTLGATDAKELETTIRNEIERLNVIESTDG